MPSKATFPSLAAMKLVINPMLIPGARPPKANKLNNNKSSKGKKGKSSKAAKHRGRESIDSTTSVKTALTTDSGSTVASIHSPVDNEATATETYSLPISDEAKNMASAEITTPPPMEDIIHFAAPTEPNHSTAVKADSKSAHQITFSPLTKPGISHEENPKAQAAEVEQAISTNARIPRKLIKLHAASVLTESVDFSNEEHLFCTAQAEPVAAEHLIEEAAQRADDEEEERLAQMWSQEASQEAVQEATQHATQPVPSTDIQTSSKLILSKAFLRSNQVSPLLRY
jgi:hypothetical protein